MIDNTKLFLDYDGVICDFGLLSTEILGMPMNDHIAQFKSKETWRKLRRYRCPQGRGFYEALPLMPDAMVLYEAVKHLDPTILTGCPFGDWAPPQKVAHAAANFPGVPIITCMAVDKRLHMANPGDILIDDTVKHKAAWEEAGGVWITHTSAESSIAQLRELKPEWFL